MGVRANNNIGIKKCTTNFLWVLNFRQVGELPQQFSKSQYYGDFFQKWSPTCDFLKNLQGIFSIKLKAIFFMGFLLKIEGDFKTFFEPPYRPLLSVLVDSGDTECTTLQKLSSIAEVRSVDSTKVIVSEVKSEKSEKVIHFWSF